MNNDSLAEYFVKISPDVDDLKKEMSNLKKNVEKDVAGIKDEFKKLGTSGKAAFDGIDPSVKELHKRVEDLSTVLRTSHKDSKAYAIASREMEVVINQLGETQEVTKKKTLNFKEGLRTLATQFFNTAGAGSGMGTVLSTMAYGIFSGGGILAAASAATLAFQLLTKSQKEDTEATIGHIEKIKSLSDELENMSRRELLRQMVKNEIDIMKLESEAKSNVDKMLNERKQKNLLMPGTGGYAQLDPVKTLTAEQQEQLRLLKEQNTTIQALTRDRSVLKGIDAEISDLRKQQEAITQEELKADPKKLLNLQAQIDKLEKYAKVLKGIKDSSGSGHNKQKVYTPENIDARHMGFSEDGMKTIENWLNERNDLTRIKNGEMLLQMKEVNAGILDDSMLTTEAILQDWIEKNQEIVKHVDLVRDISMRAFDEIRIRAAANANATTRFWVDAGNMIINKLKEILTQMLITFAIKSLFNFIVPGAGAAIPMGHFGGNFIGTSNGVRKMSGGGSFIVPPGFSNDSYPLLVESGERVSVTSRNDMGLQGKQLGMIQRQLAILNSNFLDNSTRRTKKDTIGVVGKIGRKDIFIASDNERKSREAYK